MQVSLFDDYKRSLRLPGYNDGSNGSIAKYKSVVELKVTKFQSLFSFIKFMNWSSSMNNQRYIDNFKGLQPRSAKYTKNGRIVGMFDFIETKIDF